ncbi:segregation/condensation protein A [Candidatus Woesearchaeota archaeon]|nr:segregation/condensation protein A [Candidatus Woesearchaeota archaeon]
MVDVLDDESIKAKAEEIEKEISGMEGLDSKPGHETVLDLIVKKDDVTWKTIILELVNSNKMDPWNIDIKLLTKEYLRIVKELKEHDFRVSGKIILAAALLLKVKSIRLLEGDLNALDQLFANTQDQEEDMLDMTDEVLPDQIRDMESHKLIPRTPQPRKRKVSIYDLVDALEKALEVKERRILRRMPTLDLEIPKKTPDVTVLMGHLFEKIEHLYALNKPKVFFDDLTPGNTKEDKVITFIPLLHLDNLRKVDLHQGEHFSPIEVHLSNSKIQKEIEKEIGE